MNIADTLAISGAVAFPIMILVFGLSLWWVIRKESRGLETKQE